VAAGQSALSGSVGDKFDNIATRAQTASDEQIRRLDCIRASLEGLTLVQNTASGTILEKIDNIMTQTRNLHDLQTNSASSIQKLLEISPHIVTPPTGHICSVMPREKQPFGQQHPTGPHIKLQV
jgi:hypothetical protein